MEWVVHWVPHSPNFNDRLIVAQFANFFISAMVEGGSRRRLPGRPASLSAKLQPPTPPFLSAIDRGA